MLSDMTTIFRSQHSANILIWPIIYFCVGRYSVLKFWGTVNFWLLNISSSFLLTTFQGVNVNCQYCLLLFYIIGLILLCSSNAAISYIFECFCCRRSWLEFLQNSKLQSVQLMFEILRFTRGNSVELWVAAKKFVEVTIICRLFLSALSHKTQQISGGFSIPQDTWNDRFL